MEQFDWLSQHSDLSGAIKAARIQADPQARLESAIRLSSFRRDFVATERIDRLACDGLTELTPQRATQLGLTSLRLALLGSHSLGHLAAAIRVAGLQRRVALDVHLGDYGLFRQAIIGGDSSLLEFAPHLILLAIDEFNVPLGFPSDIVNNELEAALDQRVNSIRHLWQCIREKLRRVGSGSAVCRNRALQRETEGGGEGGWRTSSGCGLGGRSARHDADHR
jgi:hypothetical protein